MLSYFNRIRVDEVNPSRESVESGWRGVARIHLSQAISVIYVLVGFLFLLSACAGVSVGAPPTVKIGLVGPFEGLHRPLGYEALFAVKLALQERNARGGVEGYQVELLALNDFDDPAEAQVQATTLIADPDVLGVVGHLSAATTQAAMPIYQDAGLAMSVPWSLAATVPGTRRDGVVSVAANEAETAAWLDTIRREWGFNNIARVSDNQLDSLSPGVQALELATDGVTAGETILALEQAGISLPLLGQVDVGSPQVVQVANGAANGLIFVSPAPDPADVPGTEGFIAAYQSLAGFAPGPRAVLAYDATIVLLDAIEQAMRDQRRQPSRSEISGLINQVQRRGISGDLAFDGQGRRIDAPVWIYQISEQQYPGELIAP